MKTTELFWLFCKCLGVYLLATGIPQLLTVVQGASAVGTRLGIPGAVAQVVVGYYLACKGAWLQRTAELGLGAEPATRAPRR
ncbi:MAG: hypothetical protein AAF628_09195 [Planctomycetota bacterium]